MPEGREQDFVLRVAVMRYRHTSPDSKNQMVNATDVVLCAKTDSRRLASGIVSGNGTYSLKFDECLNSFRNVIKT